MDYDKEIISEGGYVVELSNRGGKKKNNPNPSNPDKEPMNCIVEGCDKKTRSPYRLCAAHNRLKYHPLHEKDWLGRIILPGKTREDCLTYALPHVQIAEFLINWIGDNEERGRRVDSFVDGIIGRLHGKIPDATTLQKVLSGEISGVMGPDDFVETTKELVEEHFPQDEFSGEVLDGTRVKFKNMNLGKVPLRVIAASLVLALGCEESNRGDARGCRLAGLPTRYANMFMAVAPYLLMRKGATKGEARASVK